MSGFTEYEDFDALGLADLVRRNEVTPDELLSRNELRPVWRTREEIEEHLEKREVF